MEGESERGTQADGRGTWARFAAEAALVAALFAAVGAWPVPDVNEAVYLTKARHAANPAWGAGDFFLETPDAHGVFYLLFGPLTAALPLEQAAWIGRWAGWIGLAVGFCHVAAPVVATAWGRLLAAAVFSLLLRHTTMAGEWVIGGCEAKVFAWAFVLGGVGEWLRGRCGSAWLLGGIATAWHPIVGGWAMVALAAAWLLAPAGGCARPHVALVVAGLAIAAAGVIPALALSAGADAATRAAAARIYVVERLHHHLLLRSFPEAMVARHLLAVLAWWLCQRSLAPTPARARLTTFTLAALGISLAGAVMSLLEPAAPDAAIGLLRFYWFRLADVAVPLALAVSATALLEDDGACRRAFGGRPAAIRATLVVLLAIDLVAQSAHWPLPGRAAAARADSKVDAVAWRDICAWVTSNTPPEARFLTPRGAASFTWRTARPEVVAWKNSPQDAASLVEWRRRIIDCFAANGNIADMERTTAALGPERVERVRERYGAEYAIVPLDSPRLAEMPGVRVHANGVYAVYHLVPRAPDAPRP